MYIKDAIHGLMRFSDEEQKIIDSQVFQRLRKVKQLSFVDLVYPSANHTRFSHSLGTAHLAGMVASSLELDVGLARLKGLLHDIGHPPFSHIGEDALSKFIGTHEQRGKQIIKEEISPIISSYSLKELLSNDIHEEIISCEIGVDRLDYLYRDAYYTGVSYGVIDLDRIMETMVISEGNKLCIDFSGLESLEAFVLARFFMSSAVYQHRVVRIAAEMAKSAIRLAIEDGMDINEFVKMGDEQACSNLFNYSGKEYIKRILNRKLYKSFLEIEKDRYDENIQNKIHSSLNCDVIVVMPSMEQSVKQLFVAYSGEYRSAKDVSEFINIIDKVSSKRKNVIIAIPPEYMSDAEKLKRLLTNN